MYNPVKDLFDRLGQIDQAHREILFASVFLVFWLAIGTLGYATIEDWPLMDGLYMTFITLTTIGFGEVKTLSTVGRVFTILIAVVGIGSVAFLAARSAQLLLAGQLLRQRQIARRIRHMHDHYIICGFGRIGRRVAEDLQHAGKAFVAIDLDEERIAALQEAGVPAILGDAEDEKTLRQAGIEQAKGLITLLHEDSNNVFVTLVARELNPNLFILARTNETKNRRRLLQAGAQQVVAPSDVGADRMAQVILRPNVDRVMAQVLKASSLSLQMDEVKVEADAPLAVDAYRMLPGAVALEGLQAVARRHAKLIDVGRRVQQKQLAQGAASEVRRDAAVLKTKEAFGLAVGKGADHVPGRLNASPLTRYVKAGEKLPTDLSA